MYKFFIYLLIENFTEKSESQVQFSVLVLN